MDPVTYFGLFFDRFSCLFLLQVLAKLALGEFSAEREGWMVQTLDGWVHTFDGYSLWMGTDFGWVQTLDGYSLWMGTDFGWVQSLDGTDFGWVQSLDGTDFGWMGTYF